MFSRKIVFRLVTTSSLQDKMCNLAEFTWVNLHFLRNFLFLGRVKFPYATEDEMNVMEQAIQSAFTDIQSNSSLKKALTVYQSTHKKIAALIQWFDKVINDTILKDLDKANTNVSKLMRLKVGYFYTFF